MSLKTFKQSLSFFILSLFLVTSVLPQTSWAQQACYDVFKTEPRKILDVKKAPDRNDSRGLMAFAIEHNLETRVLELGPADRKIKRLFVAIDIKNEALMKAYYERFNLDTPINAQVAGTLVLDYTKESLTQPEHYVPAIVRRTANPKDKGYRWGKPDPYMESYEQYYQEWILRDRRSPDFDTTGIAAFSHLIELSPAERDNVRKFLDNPDLRGPCKSDNCVAWQTGIELGKTDKDVPDAERRYLFNELGISRSMAHFEIGRRLMHAANERHNQIAVFVNGELGLTTFKTALEKNLVPEPKIPYASILRNYQAKTSAALKAMDALPDGARVFMPIAAGASPEAVGAMIQKATTLKKGIDLHVLVNGVSANDFRKGVETTDGKFRVHALFLGGNMRELYAEGKVDVVPGNLSDFTRFMKDPSQTAFQYDAIVVRVSPANAEGYHSLGPNNDMIMTILRHRPDIKIIAEVNPNVPFTHGNNKIHKNQLISTFESQTQLAGPAVVPPSAVDAKIGYYIGSLVESRAKLQIGIGNIFSGVPDGLQAFKRKGITISTEMFGDPMMDMMNRGIAVKAETGFAYGSANLYRWLHGNEKVEFKETELVNNPGRISRYKKFHAVNTALQVNLFGESNATMGPNGRISSPGGQVEFMTGAARSEGGKAIIAIRSTAKEGTLSSIVLDFYKGPITTPHESVTHVVTEYGVAELRGKGEPDRAVALINIAHPKFRKQLTEQALERGLIHQADLVKINLAEQ